MEALQLFRWAQKAQAAKAVGQDARQPRITVGQMQSIGSEADMRALPMDVSKFKPLQNSAGAFYFMADFSTIDGDDVIA